MSHPTNTAGRLPRGVLYTLSITVRIVGQCVNPTNSTKAGFTISHPASASRRMG